MITDFQILGIAEGSDLTTIKSAFRRRAKELHPDLAEGTEALKRHELFVEVCRAYRRLAESLSSKGPATGGPGAAPAPKIRPSSQEPSRRLPAPYADQAYGFYKTGMRYFSAIHPSQWNLDTGRMLNTAIAGHVDEQDAIKGKIMELVKLFPRAYYYFSIVVHEYPESAWAYDAGQKLATIEERVRRYRHIIESFSTWNVDEKARSRQYHESYDATIETQKAVRRDKPKDWDR